MTDTAPIATVEGRQASAALGDRTAWTAALAVAVVVGAGTTVTGVPSSLVGGPLAVAVGVGFATFCVLVGASVLGDTATVRFHRDRVVTEARPGPLGVTASVPYDDVDLVVREDGGDGTGTFELLRSGVDPIALRNVRDPATVERVLDERVPSPRGREERASDEDDGFDRAIEHERILWRRWPSDRALPESAVVAATGPAAALDGRVDVRSRSGGGAHDSDTVSDATVEELARGQHGSGGNTGDPLSDGNITDSGTPGASSSGGMGAGGGGGDGGMGVGGGGGDGGGM